MMMDNHCNSMLSAYNMFFTVQRHAARALWHVASASAYRPALVNGDCLAALLRLAQPSIRSVQAQSLAKQALKKLAQDPQVGAWLCFADWLEQRW